MTPGEDPDAALREAQARHRQGDLEEAARLYEAILAREPDHFDALRLLTVVCLQRDEPGRGLELADKAAAQRPGSAVARYNLGNALADLGRWAEALAAFEEASRLDPTFAPPRVRAAAALQQLGRPEAAVEAYDAAAGLLPASETVRNSRGAVLLTLGRHAEALADFEAALALQPDLPSANYNRGVALLNLHRPQAALAALDAALAFDPAHADAHNNRSVALMELGRREEAVAALDRALALRPGDPQFVTNRAHALLGLGRFKAGWRDYDRRWESEAFVRDSFGQVTPQIRAALDLGVRREDLLGRRVLAVGEQGIGDVVMFASMLPDLLADAAEVGVLCEPRLAGLFRASFPAAAVLGPADAPGALPAFDRVVAMGSLGRLYRDHLADFPGRAYLTAREETRRRWRERLGPKTARLRVGLAWQGGLPGTGRSRRSLPLADLAPLLELPACEFVSLQHGDVAARVAAVNAGRRRPIRSFPPQELSDFEEMAGLIQGLDAVVSVQTAVVHLSGGLGVPCFAMLPQPCEWRYAAQPERMPWYASVRLFRQEKPGDWPPVIAAVARRLGEMAA